MTRRVEMAVQSLVGETMVGGVFNCLKAGLRCCACCLWAKVGWWYRPFPYFRSHPELSFLQSPEGNWLNVPACCPYEDSRRRVTFIIMTIWGLGISLIQVICHEWLFLFRWLSWEIIWNWGSQKSVEGQAWKSLFYSISLEFKQKL